MSSFGHCIKNFELETIIGDRSSVTKLISANSSSEQYLNNLDIPSVSDTWRIRVISTYGGYPYLSRLQLIAANQPVRMLIVNKFEQLLPEKTSVS